MGLDFSKLDRISADQTDKPPKIAPAGGLLDGGEGNTTTKSKNHAEGLKTASTGLQIEADQTRAEIERTAAIYSEYQSNIKASGQLQAEITKGVLQGESVYTLFLKAAKAISCMTGNTLFYKQLEGDIKTIYGEGLLEPAPLEMEIEAIKDRLQHLRSAKTREGTTGESQSRIEAAIAAHEQRKEQLQALYMSRSERGKE